MRSEVGRACCLRRSSGFTGSSNPCWRTKRSELRRSSNSSLSISPRAKRSWRMSRRWWRVPWLRYHISRSWLRPDALRQANGFQQGGANIRSRIKDALASKGIDANRFERSDGPHAAAMKSGARPDPQRPAAASNKPAHGSPQATQFPCGSSAQDVMV